jgi:K+-transporting ATPase ATPase B chain
VLAKQRFALRERSILVARRDLRALLGADPHERRELEGRQIRKGALDAGPRHVEPRAALPAGGAAGVEDVARRGSTPLVVATAPPCSA